jgi:hypothetical protein
MVWLMGFPSIAGILLFKKISRFPFFHQPWFCCADEGVIIIAGAHRGSFGTGS